MTKQKRKVGLATAAVTAATALLLTGTFAWTSISQTALNEKIVEANPGGRLHDDFDGTNKDVYVENFGGSPIFARVRLDEYMEIGMGAGLKTGDGDYGAKQAEPLVPGADINDPSTWKTHVPDAEDDPFHEYVEWELGGQTVYMPTFNKNKDSLKADINGTYDGTDATDDIHYDDYHAYTLGETKTGDEIYDADEDTEDESDPIEGTDITIVPDQEHTAKNTLDGAVMTMAEWKAKGSPLGNYWVYDADGWAYWAMPIQPGEATGLLLDGLVQKKMPTGEWYYGINVVAQFVTEDDLDKLENPSEDAKKLLEQAANTTLVTGEDGKTYMSYGDNTFKVIGDDGTVSDNFICGGEDEKPGSADDRTDVYVLTPADETYGGKFLGPQEDGSYLAVGPDGKLGTDDDLKVRGNPTLQDGVVLDVTPDKVTVSTKNDASAKVKAGGTLELKAAVTGTVNGKDEPAINQNVTWSLEGSYVAGTSINTSGVLTVAAGETAEAITVKATSQQDNALTGTITVQVAAVNSVTVTADAENVGKGKTLQFTATVTGHNLDEANEAVTWSVSGSTNAGTTINDSGLLTVAANETAESLTVTATSVFDESKTESKTVTIAVAETKTIDGVTFYVLAKRPNEQDSTKTDALLWAKEPVGSCIFGSSNVWNESCTAYTELQKWLESTETLKDKAIDTTIYTRDTWKYTGNNTYNEMTTKVFLLSEADVFGTANGQATSEPKEYTCGEWKTERLTADPEVLGSSNGGRGWLRSPRINNDSVAQILKGVYGATISEKPKSTVAVLLPALWVTLD